MTIRKLTTIKGSFDTYDNFIRRNPLNYHVCCNCGSKIIQNEEKGIFEIPWMHEGETYCEECFFQHHKICMECGEHHDEDKMIYHEMGAEGEEIVYFTCKECDKKHKAFLQTVRQNFSYEIFNQVKTTLYKTEEICDAIKKLESLTSDFINQLKAQ